MNTSNSISNAPSSLSQLIAGLHPGAAIALGDITLVPLLSRGIDAAPPVDLLEDGIESGVTKVTEVSDSGVVARVRVEHRGQRLLLLVDGEQITGAKQNRILNSSFLIAPGVTVDVPVSCVESGRWQHNSASFEASGKTLNATARAQKLRRVRSALNEGRSYEADQAAVWRDVDDYLHRTDVSSDTSAYEDAYRVREEQTENRLSRLSPLPEQVGIAAVRSDQLIALDIFNTPALYARAWKKIVRGQLAEQYGTDVPAGDAAGVVTSALAVLATAEASVTAAPGCGTTLHGDAAGIAFAAIEHEGRVFHATATAA